MFYTSEIHVSMTALKNALETMNQQACTCFGEAPFSVKEVKRSDEHEYVITTGEEHALPVSLHVAVTRTGHYAVNLFVFEYVVSDTDEVSMVDSADGIDMDGPVTQEQFETALLEVVDMFVNEFAPAWRENTHVTYEQMSGKSMETAVDG